MPATMSTWPIHCSPTTLLSQSFFERDALDVARELVGTFIHRDNVLLRITETEAYRWPDDTACHAYRGPTARNAVMFGPPGRAYVYLCYGVHWMLNFVTNRRGEGAAVLIRACEPVAGIEKIRSRRGDINGPALLNGPGKVAQALALDRSANGTRICGGGLLDVLQADVEPPLLCGPRVGIDYALKKHIDAPWRFADAQSEWVSHRKKLRPFKAARRQGGGYLSPATGAQATS